MSQCNIVHGRTGYPRSHTVDKNGSHSVAQSETFHKVAMNQVMM